MIDPIVLLLYRTCELLPDPAVGMETVGVETIIAVALKSFQ